MAEKPLKRCAESVVLARLTKTYAPLFQNNETLITSDAPKELAGSGLKVEAMALHPGGLAIKHKGEVVIVPVYDYVRLVKGEQ
jgi:hypothetical protein